MATVLRLLQDGSEVFNFNSGGNSLLYFTNNGPETRAETFEPSYTDGVTTLYANFNDVQDTIRFMISGATKDAVSAAQEGLEAAIKDASYALLTEVPNIVLEWQPDGYTSAWQTTITRFLSIKASEDRLQELYAKAAQTNQYIAVVVVELEHKYFWESSALEAIPLTNLHGTDVTTGLSVDNHDDTLHDNYATMNAADVKGSLPSPLYLEMTNNNNSATRIRNVFVGHGAVGTPTSWPHTLEAETAFLYSGASVVGPLADYSGDSQQAVSVTGIDASLRQYAYWQLSQTLQQESKGRWIKVLAFIYSAGSGTLAQWILSAYGLTIYQRTRLASIGAGVFDVGTFKIPPFKLAGSGSTDLRLSMYLQHEDTGTPSLVIDYLMLIPTTEPDGVSQLTPLSYNLPYTATLIYDGPNKAIRVDHPSEGEAQYYAAKGSDLVVYPGKTQRLYFVHDRDTGRGDIAWTLNVLAKYKQRRLRP